jgi:hypothetical protein
MMWKAMTAVETLILASAAALAQAPAVTVPDYAHAPISPGSWSYRPAAGYNEAVFVDTGGTIRLAMRCTRANRRVTISRISSAPAATLQVWTSSESRTLPARFEANAMRVSADVQAGDRLLDAVAFSRGRIAVATPGLPVLVVTNGPEAARVFEDCRN